MKLVVNKDMKNNAYKVDLEVLDITDTDKEKISDFGQIVVDVGGVILGKEIVQEYVAVQEPVTEIVTETQTVIEQQTVTEKQTVIEKQTVDETQLVFEADGVTPVYEADGVTQKTQVVQVEKDVPVEKDVEVVKDVEVQKDVQVEKPVLDANGEPVTQDKLDANGEKIYQLVEKEVDVVVADLGKQLRNFPADFPLSRTFTVAEFGEKTETIANEYITLVKNALEVAIDILETKVDTFSGKEEIQL